MYFFFNQTDLGGGGGSGRPPSGHAEGVVGGYPVGYGNSGAGTGGGDPSPYGSPQAPPATRHSNKPPSPTTPHQWNNSLRQVIQYYLILWIIA